MSIDKFRFVSPGVYINEIDNSQLPKIPGEIGPVVIGRSQRGPSMRPVKVSSFSDFIEVFGEPLAGGEGGDIWRNGNKTAPTYAAYAAQAYLRNSNALTFVRLAGMSNPNNDGSTAGKGGWKTQYAYGLFVMPISSSGAGYTNASQATASLAAIIYSSDTNFGLTGKPLSGSTDISKQLGTWVRSTGANLEFKLVVPNPAGSDEVKTINFDENSKKYIRTVLNTNPILTNNNIASAGSNQEKYFLGETFKTWVEQNNSSNLGSGPDQFAAVLVDLAVGTVDFGSFNEEAKSAATGYVISQHVSQDSSSFSANAAGEYPVTKLFRFVSLTEGEWNSQNIKISIEDIKEPPNEFIKYGTFTVSVRKIDDNDLTPIYLERFTNVTLDPSSQNFISKVIGDKYSTWDYEKKLFKEYGTYNNKSKFIRVEVNPDVENGFTEPSLIPFGYYGPNLYTASAPAAVGSGSGIEVGGVTFNNTVISGNFACTASFALPQIPNLTSTSQFPYPSFSSVYWGFKTNYRSSRKYNKDIVDVVRAQPKDYSAPAVSYMFSLDDVSGSITGSALDTSKPASWVQGNRKAGKSISSTNLTASDGSRVLLSYFNKFTMPMFGGSEGVDITEKDPFNTRALNNKTEYTSYAYNSIKVAVESIADAEVVEMNLAAIPGVENESLTSLLIEKCEMRGDALAVVDLRGDYVPEEGKSSATTSAAQRKPVVDAVVANLKNRAMNSSYGCAFFPWVLIKDTINNNTVWVPSSVVALGTFSSSQRKTELWFAPAGFNRGGLTDGSSGLPVLQTSLRLSSKDRDKLYEANINPIATFPAEGIVIFGQKTLQVTPSALDRINVRRLMIYLKKEISRFASSVLFDPNTQVTWKRFLNLADPFLQSVRSRFGLEDYKIVLDETTTTPELVDRNIVYAKILLKPTRAIEFIALDFVITNTGASFKD